MVRNDIYTDIANRTNGDLFIGVVGPVRTGKSTFISKVLQNFVIPNINNKLQKQIAIDEMPQSANGNGIMTSQPMFFPSNSVKVSFNKTSANIRLVDCVGYYVEGATGNLDGDKPRMVKTPWSDKEISFEDAGTIGTKKVISDYSTIGIMITTDGSFTDISRENYEKTEAKVIKELKSLNKPFVIVLNTSKPKDEKTLKLAVELETKYDAPVISKNVEELSNDDISNIFEKVLLEFPMREFNVNIPDWISVFDKENEYVSSIVEVLKEKSQNVCKMKDYYNINECFFDSNDFEPIELNELNLSKGEANFTVKAKEGLFYNVLSGLCNEEIKDNCSLMTYIKDFATSKKEFLKIKDALNKAEEGGYGVVLPLINEVKLDEPVLTKQGNKFGVKLKATAPSLHIVKVDVSTEISPIVGENKQGEEMANFIIDKFENGQEGVLKTEMFGKSLYDLIGEGMNSKVNQIPKEVQGKLQKTMSKIVNENRGGILCILL